MDRYLKEVAESYDRTIKMGRMGIDLYENLPEMLKKDSDYAYFQGARENGGDSDSGSEEIKKFLSPTGGMRFIDLGCCLNLMFHGYEKWESTYYGIDISGETIKLLREFVDKKRLPIGGLYQGSVDDTPFEDAFFDIGACIGVLEYFDKDFVWEALKEMHRILKPQGKMVLDVPDISGRMRRFMNLVEEFMGRADRFRLSVGEFEGMLEEFFEIEKKEVLDGVAMVQYFLRRKL